MGKAEAESSGFGVKQLSVRGSGFLEGVEGFGQQEVTAWALGFWGFRVYGLFVLVLSGTLM